ncbi:MAG: LysR family transcriptional regulator [Pseudomonadota bacterium]
MQIELVETFLDLCETRSFNRTAERLGITQSTVSGRIKSLEARFGRPLFKRSRAGTALTTEGLRFEPHARALRLSWSEAWAAVREEGATAMTLRLSIQHDLAGARTPAWVSCCREVFPGAKVFVEADFSSQMCEDLMSGTRDVAIIYTPRPHPDLHFQTLGEVRYRMVSDAGPTLAAVRPDDYVLTDFSPAFARTHAALHPHLHEASVVSGQNDTVVALLIERGGAAYVLEETAARLAARGFDLVRDAPAIDQSFYVALHLRNRHRRAHRRLAARLRALVDRDGLVSR